MHANRQAFVIVGLAAALLLICSSTLLAGTRTIRIGDNVDLRPSDTVPQSVPAASDGDGFAVENELMSVTFPGMTGSDDDSRATQVTAMGFAPLTLRATALITVDESETVRETDALGASLGEATENSVRYPNVRTGIDEVFSVYETRVKHELILLTNAHAASGAKWLGYQAVLTVPADYEITTGQGDAIKADQPVDTFQFIAPSGTAPYRFPLPVAIDAQGAEINGVYSIQQLAEGTWRVQVLFAADWFDTAAYPVRLDPTVQIPAGTIGNHIPFNWVRDGTWPNGAVYQTSYSAAQMTQGGTITEVGVQFVNTFTCTFNRIEIWLGETSRDSGQFVGTFADNFDISGPVLVYDGVVNWDVVSGGYDTVQLQNTFNYSGNNTLLVEYRVHPGTSNHTGGTLTVRTGGQTVENFRNYFEDANATTGGRGGNHLTGAQFEILDLDIIQPPNYTIPDAYEGDAITEQFQADGGTAPYDFSATGLPGGVSMDSSGLLTGTLDSSTAGSHTVDVTVTDANSAQSTIPFSWTIYAPPEISGDFPNATVGFAYSEALSLTGGQAPFTWSLLGSTPSLPASLTLNTSTGELEGTPAIGDDGTYQLTIEVTDDGGRSDTHTAQLVIDPPHEITLDALPEATDTGGYGPIEVTVTGGQGPFGFDASGLPAGLSLNPTTGIISGTVDASASQTSPYSVTITVEDTNTATDQVTLDLVVNPVPQVGPDLPSGQIGLAYSEFFDVTGGTAPLVFDVVELPDGLEFDPATGEVFGVPTHENEAALYELDVTLTDANNVSVQTLVELRLQRVIASGSSGCECTTPTNATTSQAAWLPIGALLVLLALWRRPLHF